MIFKLKINFLVFIPLSTLNKSLESTDIQNLLIYYPYKVAEHQYKMYSFQTMPIDIS